MIKKKIVKKIIKNKKVYVSTGRGQDQNGQVREEVPAGRVRAVEDGHSGGERRRGVQRAQANQSTRPAAQTKARRLDDHDVDDQPTRHKTTQNNNDTTTTTTKRGDRVVCGTSARVLRQQQQARVGAARCERRCFVLDVTIRRPKFNEIELDQVCCHVPYLIIRSCCM